MVDVLHRHFGLERGFTTTGHADTGGQRLLDAPHKDLRRARSAALNIIPTTTGADEVNAAFAEEAAGRLRGVLCPADPAFGSGDVVGDPASCVFDAPLTQVRGDLVKVFGWYDNEWGYCARLVDLAEYVCDVTRPDQS